MWRDPARRYRILFGGGFAILGSMQALDTSVGGDSPEAHAARRIAAAAPGEARDAEAELYRLLAPRARRYGLRHLRDAHAAADLMQQVMTLTIEQLRGGQLREPERVLSFVLGTCRLTVMDQRRGERRREDLLQRYADALPIADLHVAPRFDHERVADCLERLPERERSVLVMSFYDDQPSEAVGQQLGLSCRQRARDPPPRHRQAATLRRPGQEGGMSATPQSHPSIETLLDYWLDDSDAAAVEAIDEHLMQCDPCGQALDDLIALGEGVRAAFRSGAVAAMASDAFLKRVSAAACRCASTGCRTTAA